MLKTRLACAARIVPPISTVAEIQAAADNLPVAGSVQLFQHRAQDASIRRKPLALLRAAIDEGSATSPRTARRRSRRRRSTGIF